MGKRILCTLAAAAALALASEPFVPEVRGALDRISAVSMRGNLSFLSSDLLEGRATPSRGLDIAAEFIASRFRSAGLEPAGDDGYFQTATMAAVAPNMDGVELTLEGGGRKLRLSRTGIQLATTAAAEVTGAAVFRTSAGKLASLKPAQVAGKALALEIHWDSVETVVREAARLKPAALLDLSASDLPPELTGVRLRPAGSQPVQRLECPWIVLRNAEARRWIVDIRHGDTGATLSLRIPPPSESAVKVRNVIGVLRGSDPVLKDTYLLITAHYDHIGVKPDGEGDRIYNGANDDGSGTVSVIEIARALASLPRHPRRTIVFLTFFGEEKGGLGSQYYIRHPVFPLARTIADLNLEQLGRTDSTDGTEVASVTMTGFDFTSISGILRKAGKETGIRVWNAPDGDAFYNRSDNISFARAGVPDHTICVAYDYPDYHGLGDEWPKINYENMARVARTIALAAVMIADNPEPPKWNTANPATAEFVKARAAE